MTEQKCITIGELREQIKDLPDDCKVSMKFFDWHSQEYITDPVEEIYCFENELILR